MKLNKATTNTAPRTYEGGQAEFQKPELELERAVATCLLWEPTFYEKGDEIAARIADLCGKVTPTFVRDLAIKARSDYKLRHVPLFLARQLARVKTPLVAETLKEVIQRPDELCEFLSIYWKDKKQPLSAQTKKGLAAAFSKFTPYQFQKWDRDSAIKLRDVMFLVHPKPKAGMDAVYKQIAERTLEPADTWEVALSAGKDKKETWERLLAEKKLGYIALLMNLRNMSQANVDPGIVARELIAGAPKSKALPFRFVSAFKYAPQFANSLDQAMKTSMKDFDTRLDGTTILLVDVSGSMDTTISAKSELLRWEAAAALAILCSYVCERFRVFTFSNRCVEVPALTGLGMLGGIRDSQEHGGTELGKAQKFLEGRVKDADRLIIITDEQAHSTSIYGGGLEPCSAKRGYLINVAPYKPGLEASAKGFERINGWSERILDWIRVEESISAS